MALPRDEYLNRLDLRRRAHRALSDTDIRFGNIRLAVFAAGAICAIAAWRGSIAWWWLVAPAAVFLYLVRRHDRIVRDRDAAARAVHFYERGLSRIDDTWEGQGEPGDRFANPAHLYAADLDLFGRGSLFELLSIARTRAGEETLAGWLTAPAAPAVLRQRQEAVAELVPQLDLREALSLAGSDVRAGVHGDALVEWASGRVTLRARPLRVVAIALSSCALVAAAYWGATSNPAPFFAALVLEVLYWLPLRPHVTRALHAAEGPARDLDILAHVLGHLERTTVTAPGLVALRAQLDTEGIPASTAIRSLHRLVELHDWQHNQFFAPVAAAVLWGTHLAWAIEAWRARHGTRVATWLQAVGEFEALSSLSAYAYEHPSDPFPQIDEALDHPAFEGVGLGHPLLPAARLVRNDICLSGSTGLLVVSGSNMSGKSTMLRTVGINLVLALAGAPVRAVALRTTPLELGATLRIQDSLQEGRSRFYAEITRIRELVEVARRPPGLLFLLDELFHGTNSHDRVVGASGVLRSLLDLKAIGLVTTHDLALTAVADDLAPRAVNVHFDDHLEAGDIRFDYRIKPGPVTRSNALALMRAVGLQVEPD